MALEVIALDSATFPPALRRHATEFASDARGTLARSIPDHLRRPLFAPALRKDQILVALRDGQVAGMAMLKCRGRAPVAPRLADFVRVLGWRGLRSWAWFRFIQMRIGRAGLYIAGIDALDGFLRKGVGTALIDALAAAARRHGIDCIEANVRDGNDAAQAFFRRAGFQPARDRFPSCGWWIRVTNGKYTRLRLHLGPGPRA